MKLAISNLAWPADDAATVLRGLAARGVAGIELAPTRLGPWDQLSPSLLKSYVAEVSALGMSIPSLQAILYGVPDARLLGDSSDFSRLAEQLRRISDIAGAVGARRAVYGAPASRKRGSLSGTECFELAVERLHFLGELLLGAGDVALCIEPVPTAYGSDIMTSPSSAAATVRAIDHPRIRLHLDTGCAYLGGDDIPSAVLQDHDILAHFHISEPQLAAFDDPKVDHARAAAALREVGYGGWTAIEMREPPGGTAAIWEAIELAQKVYGSTNGEPRS